MIKSYFQLTTLDSDQAPIKKSRKMKSRSFLKNMGILLYNLFLGSSVTILKHIDGTDTETYQGFYYYIFSGIHPGKDTYTYNFGGYLLSQQGTADKTGIIVGANNTAVTITDYKLNTTIANGTSSGQLEYLSCAAENYQTSGGNVTFDIVRLFRNSSGGTITIQEVGLYVKCAYNSGGSLYEAPFCVIRDVVSPLQSVGDGEYLKVTYTIQI